MYYSKHMRKNLRQIKHVEASFHKFNTLSRQPRLSAAATASLALADQLPHPMIVKRGWSGFPIRRAI